MKQPSRFNTSAYPALRQSYTKTVLSNGVRVITEELPHVRSVSLGIWIDTGSRDESGGSNGISHFFEHMVFKGTAKRSVQQIARSLESVGGYLNAFTGKEHTCYYARVLDEHAGLAMDVVSDLLANPVFPEKEIDKEKGVIIEEMRNAEDDPDDIIHDVLDGAMFGNHPLGLAVIGTENNVRSFTREDLQAFQRARYAGHRLVVSAAGRITHDKVVELAERYLGGVQADSNGALRSRPRLLKGRLIRREKPIQQAHVAIGCQAYSVRHPNRYPLLVLNTLLGDGMSSRLFQRIREQRGIAYTVYSFANMMTDAGTFGVYTGLDRSNIDRTLEIVWQELEKLTRQPVGTGELRRTKDQLKGSMMLSLESIPNRMMRLGGAELAIGKLPSLDAILDSIEQVSRESIMEVAQSLFKRERFSTVLFEPAEPTQQR